MTSLELWHDVQQFLFFEARLQDERRFEEWVELFTDDTLYWLPLRTNRVGKDVVNEVSQLGELSYFEEDKTSLRNRILRLNTGMAWAETPPSRTRHLVSNLQVAPGANDAEVLAHCIVLVYRTHLEQDEDIIIGDRKDVLRRVDGEWRIARRTVVIDQAVLTAKNLSMFF